MPRSLRNFRFALLTAMLALLILCAAIVLVDPYGLYATPTFVAFNEKKPRAYQHAVLAKRVRVKRATPRTLLFGNSRIDVGFDPLDPAWPESFATVFNAAIPGQGFDRVPGYLDRLDLSRPPENLIVGLDFLDFLDMSEARASNDTVRPHEAYRIPSRFKDFLETTVSLAALYDSVVTVWEQRDPFTSSMTDLGHNTSREFLREFAIEGQHAVVIHRDLGNLRFMRRLGRSLSKTERSRRAYASLDAVLERIAAHGERGWFLIYPYHADMMESLVRAGLWDAFEQWKGEIVRRVRRAARENPAVDLALWDFSGYSPFTTEAVPAPDNRTDHMRWFWEPSHFSAELGHVVIETMLGRRAPVGSFGVRIDKVALDAHHRMIRAERARYEREHPQGVERVRGLAARLIGAR